MFSSLRFKGTLSQIDANRFSEIDADRFPVECHTVKPKLKYYVIILASPKGCTQYNSDSIKSSLCSVESDCIVN